MNHTGHEHPSGDGPGAGERQARRGHGWLMIACCIPMLVIAIVLVATGIAGAGFIVAAVVCALMMAVMMRGMHGGDGRS